MFHFAIVGDVQEDLESLHPLEDPGSVDKNGKMSVDHQMSSVGVISQRAHLCALLGQ